MATTGVTHIQNPGVNWEVNNNAFEIGANGPATIGVSSAYLNPIVGLDFRNNFDGDDTGSGVYTKFTLPANSTAHFHGGNFISATHTNVTGFSVGNGSALVVEGNSFAEGSSFGTLFSLGTGVSVNVGPNRYGTITSFLAGTPASGSVLDNSGKTTYYGAQAVNGADTGYKGNPILGFPAWTATYSQQASANIGTTLLYAVPASPTMTCIAFVMSSVDIRAGSSSTLPSTTLTWTDINSGIPQSFVVTPTNTGNLTSTFQSNQFMFNPLTSTNVQWFTSGYASNPANTMGYAVTLKLLCMMN